jgi:DNA-binding NtrC family response regulator
VQTQKLLIVDDEVDMLEGLYRILNHELKQVEVVVCASPPEVSDLVRRNSFDMILLDVCMPEMDGIELLETIRRQDESITVIMMTAYGTIEIAVEAIKKGAYDFITKPFEIPDLLRLLNKGLERSNLIRENVTLRRQVTAKAAFEAFIGQSPPAQRLHDTIRALANTDYAVLIRGESGSGKELVARAIHALSKRSCHPLVAVNCPAIPEHLLESELFGHQRGAFTGALTSRKGLFEEAHNSSLLLDEIADIPVSIQTKLLRVLQEQEIRPLGGSRSIHVDVRIISSTNQNLEEKIQNRSFREDLFYRLNVVTVFAPSLREMREDISLLVNHFMLQVCRELDLPLKSLTPPAMDALIGYDWPGNVRELQNFVRRLVLFSTDPEITPREVQNAFCQNAGTRPIAASGLSDSAAIEPYSIFKERMINGFTEEYVHKLLQKTQGNISLAARLAGLSRPALQKMLRRINIDPQIYRCSHNEESFS